MDYLHVCPSPLGELTMASDGRALVGLWFAGGRYFGRGLAPETARRDDLPVFQETEAWLRRYFSGQLPGALPPLAPRGSEFQRRVWALLREIPYGQTRTYGDLARRLSPKMSAQAIGGAVGRNPISILLPCHRVVGSGGALVGYGGGLGRKEWLLALEMGKALPAVEDGAGLWYTGEKAGEGATVS